MAPVSVPPPALVVAGSGLRARSGIDRYWFLVLPLLLVLAVLYAYPMFKVLWMSFTVPEPGLGNYAQLLDSGGIHRVLLTTLRVCAMTTLLAVAIGYLIAYAMVHASAGQRLAMMTALLVPFWVSVLVRAFSWLFLLGEHGPVNELLRASGLTEQPLELVRNEFGVTLGMLHFMIPYAALPLFASLKDVDPALVRAARGLGAGPFTAFRKVFLPQTLPGIVGAAIVVFIFSLGFFVTPVILGGGRTVMMGEYVSTQILQLTDWGTGTMLASVLLISVFLLLASISRVIDVRPLFGAK